MLLFLAHRDIMYGK